MERSRRCAGQAPVRGGDSGGGRVWLFGGIGEDATATADTAAYDRAINTWTPGPKLPRPLHHAAAVTYGGEAVLIGGFVPGAADLGAVRSGLCDARRRVGGAAAAQPRPRRAPAAAVVGDKIVVVGGQADGKLVPQTEVFDGERWTDAADMPTPREHLGAASDGRYVYALGGRDLSADKNVRALERYDPATDSWTKLTTCPRPSAAPVPPTSADC